MATEVRRPSTAMRTDFERADALTPMSLSVAAERAIERARAKLEQMDRQLASARSTISLVKKRSLEFQSADATRRENSASAINAAARTALHVDKDEKRLSTTTRSTELRKLRDELRNIRSKMTHSRSIIQQALSHAPPRPMRPASPDIPEMKEIDEALGGGSMHTALVAFHPKQPALGRGSLGRDRQLSIAGLYFCQPEVTVVGGIDRVRGTTRQVQNYNAPEGPGRERRSEEFDLTLFSIPIVQSEKRKAGTAGADERRMSRLVEEEALLFSPRPFGNDALAGGFGNTPRGKRVNIHTLKVRTAGSSSSDDVHSSSSDTSHETLYTPMQVCYVQPPHSVAKASPRKPSVALIKDGKVEERPAVITSLPLSLKSTPERKRDSSQKVTPPSRLRPPSQQGFYAAMASAPSPRTTSFATNTALTPSALPRPSSRLKNYTNGVTASLRAVPADDQALASSISTPATSVLQLRETAPAPAAPSASTSTNVSPFDKFRFNQSSTSSTLPRSISDPRDLKVAGLLFPVPGARPPHRTTPSKVTSSATQAVPVVRDLPSPPTASHARSAPKAESDASRAAQTPAAAPRPIVKSATDSMLARSLSSRSSTGGGGRSVQLHADALPALLGRIEDAIGRLTVRLAAEEALDVDSDSDASSQSSSSSSSDDDDGDDGQGERDEFELEAMVKEPSPMSSPLTQNSKRFATGGQGTDRAHSTRRHRTAGGSRGLKRTASTASNRSTSSSALADASRRKLEAALQILEEAAGEA